ncbi:MAG: DUF4169 family protein [Rhodobacteraceae bacterium]|nr:DUF4169 family protein [Paracoccaceae bacterium]
MTGKIVNLRAKRKQVARDKSRKTADQNSLEFGIPKPQKDQQKAQVSKAARMLDGHKRDV